MNLAFRKSKSPLVVGIIWIFVAAYCFDAANLDDLIPGNVVVHPDTNESSLAPQAASFDGLVSTPAKPASHPAAPTQCGKPHTIRIIIDQDSPSLAAEQLIAITCSTVLSEEHSLPIQSYRSSSSLYILNRALLI